MCLILLIIEILLGRKLMLIMMLFYFQEVMTCCIRSFCLSYQIFYKVSLSGNLRFIFSLLFCKLPDSYAFFFFNSCSFFRFEQPSEWNPSSIHERSVCGAVPHSTCQTEVEQKTGLLIFWLRKRIWDYISSERVLNFLINV